MSDKVIFSEEQTMLLETAMNFCASESTRASVRSQIAASSDFDAQLWEKIIDLGWLGITIPEAFGGLEMGLGAVVPVIESMGRQLMISPFLSTTLAAQALVKGGSEQQNPHPAVLNPLPQAIVFIANGHGNPPVLSRSCASANMGLAIPCHVGTRREHGFS